MSRRSLGQLTRIGQEMIGLSRRRFLIAASLAAHLARSPFEYKEEVA